MNDAQIERVAQQAHHLFAAEGWTWATRPAERGEVPGTQDISDTIRYLIEVYEEEHRRDPDCNYVTTGRLRVVTDELVPWGYSVVLELDEGDE